MQPPPAHKPLYAHLYFQVLVAIAMGVALGYFYPALGARMEPLGRGFIKLIKMMIAPIIFSTVVVGIAKMGDMKEVGRVGIKALFYFEVVTTLALVIGLVVVNVVRPGAGMNVDVSKLNTNKVAKYKEGANRSRRSISSCISFPTRSWARLPAERSFRCCSSRSCSAWRWRGSGRREDRWWISSINSRMRSSM